MSFGGKAKNRLKQIKYSAKKRAKQANLQTSHKTGTLEKKQIN